MSYIDFLSFFFFLKQPFVCSAITSKNYLLYFNEFHFQPKIQEIKDRQITASNFSPGFSKPLQSTILQCICCVNNKHLNHRPCVQ